MYRFWLDAALEFLLRMRLLKIRNVGPVTSAEIELRRLNVIIGPQSSGKSTIAKIVSFCLWLEKDILFHQSSLYVDNAFIDDQLLSYHRLNGYFDERSRIQYKSDLMTLSVTGTTIDEITVKDDVLSSAVMSKVTYVPSERNFVTIPNISSLKLENDYLRDFLFEWLGVRSRFTKQQSLDVVNLGLKYYYDVNRGNLILLESGKEISLEQASSGIQSVIPLLVMVAYSSDWIYNHEPELSYDKNEMLQRNILSRLGISNGEKLTDGTKRVLNAIIKKPNLADDLKSMDMLAAVAELARRIARPHHTHLIIEEPEQNLYPSTQRDLILLMASYLNAHCESLLLTTHSPYILSTLNVLLSTSSARKVHHDLAMPEGVYPGMLLPLEDYTAYFMGSDGQIQNIIDKDVPMISGLQLDGVSDWVDDSIAAINDKIYE